MERRWCTFRLNPKFVLTFLMNGDVSCEEILFQTPCSAPVESKVTLSVDSNMQNSAFCLKLSSIGQFPANLRRWKPLDRTAHKDRLAFGCNKTCGTQTMILIHSWILKKSIETSLKTFFLKSFLTFCPKVPLDVLRFAFKSTKKFHHFLKNGNPCSDAHPCTKMDTNAPTGRSASKFWSNGGLELQF